MADELSAFDPELFLGSEMETGFETAFATVPPGDWNGQVENIKVRKFTNKEGSEQAIMDVNWHVIDEEVKRTTELEKPTVRQSIFLDVNASGGLDRGKNKNVALGRLLEALGVNDGKPWTPRSLVGSMAKIKVEHKPNPEDPENPFANVTKVTSL